MAGNRQRVNYNNRPSADDLISNIGRPKKSLYGVDEATKKRIKAEEDLRAKIRSEHVKKGIKEAEKLTKAEEDRLAKYRLDLEKRMNRQRSLSERLETRIDSYKEKALIGETRGERASAGTKAAFASLGKSLSDSLGSAISKGFNALTKGVESYMGTYSKYMTGIEARIQGNTSGRTYSTITSAIRRNIGSSQYVSQVKMLENLNALVSEGINQNLELRAFIQTAKDGIATTFDAANGTLLHLIRIQQADSTAARLGMEAELTQFLNANYGDTSYLNSVFDSVAGALLGASSQLGRERSVEFEYNVQKWLGSLGSVGVSESTLTSLAQGLNYLGTGDISGLSGNTQLMNLFGIAAARSGVSLGGVLSGGLTSETANVLLKNIVQYGQQIASVGNQAVKAQYAQIFGLTVSDLTSLLNLSAQELDSISNHLLSYQGAINEVDRQLSLLPGRVPISERINNLIDNTFASVGQKISDNAGTYATYLINNMIMDATGGGISFDIPVPFVGFKNININKILQTGIVGLGLLTEIPAVISGLSGGMVSRNAWTEDSFKHKGWSGIKATGITRGTSSTSYIGGGGSESEFYESSLMASREQASQAGVQTDEQVAEESNQSTINNIKQALIDTEVSKLYEISNSILQVLNKWDNDGINLKAFPGLGTSNVF